MARLTPEELREYNQLLRDEASLTADQVTRLEELKRLITDTTTARKDELDTIIESNKQLKKDNYTVIEHKQTLDSNATRVNFFIDHED